jgi:cytochrome c-type biogenesis protein CcmH/NrfG
MGRLSSLKSARLGACVLGLALFAAVGYAQTGRLKGKVVDAANKPVEGATVVMESKELNRKLSTKTDRRGEYTHFLPPGEYSVTVSKDNLTQTQVTKVSIDERELNFTLTAGGGGGGGAMSEADRKKMEAERTAVQAAFTEGATLSNAGKYDEAVAKFNEVIAKLPKCVECYTNIALINIRKKDFPAAEAAYKKAIELQPTSADAYMGLANVYNAQGKSDLALEASAQASKLGGSGGAAAGGGSADALFNQGVIAWNASKAEEAMKLFQQAVAADPKYADAHYWLGMANVNQGKLPEGVKSFEEYLKLAPTGQYADQAKGMIAAIKK